MTKKIIISKFDWKICGKKLGKNIIYVFIAGLASIYGESPYFLAIAPALSAFENYLRHR